MKHGAWFLALLLISTSAAADEYVRGHVRRDGTYVAPHYRSSPNSTKIDNYSSRGNVNPYTGERGSVDPFAPRLPSSVPYDFKPLAPIQPSVPVSPFSDPPSRARSFLND